MKKERKDVTICFLFISSFFFVQQLMNEISSFFFVVDRPVLMTLTRHIIKICYISKFQVEEKNSGVLTNNDRSYSFTYQFDNLGSGL